MKRLPAVALLLALALLAPAAARSAEGDPLRDLQWGLDQVRAEAAWTRSTGAGTTIAVVDSGVDLDHPDLADRIVGGATFVGCPDQPDGCGDGDWLAPGQPGDGHGTHVAGIAAATRDNGIGVSGVAPDASLLAVKALQATEGGQTEGSTDDIAAGIRWAVRNGADVVNLSLTTRPGTQALSLIGALGEIEDAVAEAVAAGVVVVAAAGNEFGSICGVPAFEPGVLCVVATERSEVTAPYSNLAIQPGFDVLAAPGGAQVGVCGDFVLSTLPPGSEGQCAQGSGYGYESGTSMAAPHVSGVAALLLAQGHSAEQAIDIMLSTARTPTTGSRGTYTPAYGWGIVDAERAVGTLDQPVVERHAGDDRIGTAVAVSQAHFVSADAAVLARADEYADALAGAPLAAHVGGPLLLSDSQRLSAATAEELERLGAGTAYLLGGQAALSDQVARDLEERGIRPVRLSGDNRFATAASIADSLPDADEVFVVQGIDPDPNRGWPDALSASGLAAGVVRPILLTRTDRIPTETLARIGGDTAVVIVGGRSSVSEDVERRLEARARSVRRVAGEDRYGTSTAVAAEAEARGMSPGVTWVATGRAFPDGLAAGAAAGGVEGLFLLVDGHDLDGSPTSRDFLAERRRDIRRLPIAGGHAAVSERVERQLRDTVE